MKDIKKVVYSHTRPLSSVPISDCDTEHLFKKHKNPFWVTIRFPPPCSPPGIKAYFLVPHPWYIPANRESHWIVYPPFTWVCFPYLQVNASVAKSGKAFIKFLPPCSELDHTWWLPPLMLGEVIWPVWPMKSEKRWGHHGQAWGRKLHNSPSHFPHLVSSCQSPRWPGKPHVVDANASIILHDHMQQSLLPPSPQPPGYC